MKLKGVSTSFQSLGGPVTVSLQLCHYCEYSEYLMNMYLHTSYSNPLSQTQAKSRT